MWLRGGGVLQESAEFGGSPLAACDRVSQSGVSFGGNLQYQCPRRIKDCISMVATTEKCYTHEEFTAVNFVLSMEFCDPHAF